MTDATDLHKAAVLLMSLPLDEAAQLLAKLHPAQIEAVSIEIARIGQLDGDEQQSVIRQFAEVNPEALGSDAGGLELAQNLVEKALGSDAADTLDNVRQSVESVPFGFLKYIDTQNVLTFIMDEHPQTIAVILSHLPPSYGATIIAELPPERQLAVVRRIATMGETSPEVIREVEKGLERRMASVMSQSFENAGGVPAAAEILNLTDRSTERSLMENLGQEDPELVEEIRRLMFVFDDITSMADKDVQTVLKNVENSQWAMAMKGSSEQLKSKILGNMSTRAADLLREEMEYLGQVRVSEVEAMQQQVVDVIRRLEDADEITLHVNEEEEQFIQ